MRKAKEAPPTPLAAALRMLARRSYSVAEMRRALEKKCPESKDIDKVIARLRELHYLDDKKFAERYASSLVQNRAYGRYRLRRELKAKLIDYHQIEPALDQAFEETSEEELLNRILKRKVRTLRLPLTPARLASLYRSLLRRGFRADVIMKAVRQLPELKPATDGADLTEMDNQEE